MEDTLSNLLEDMELATFECLASAILALGLT